MVRPGRRHAGEAIAFALVLAAALAMFFRAALATGLTRIYGDSYDGLIEIAILEHWHAVVAKGAPIARMAWFAPHPGTLGYNDTYLVPALAYVPARLAGADPFMAAIASHAAMRAIGFAGMWALLRLGLGVRWPMALAGAALFTTANVSLLHMYHGQLMAVGLVPWLLLMLLRAGMAMHDGDRAGLRAWGIGFALLYGATAFTAFYQAWFLGLFLIVFAAAGYLALGAQGRAPLAASAWRARADLALVALAGAVALLPLLAIYLPVQSLGNRHAWPEGVLLYVPTLSSFANLGPGNLVWGRLLGMADWPAGEARVGFPPGMILAFLAAAGWAAWHRRRQPLLLAVAGALLLLMLLVLRWPSHFTLWAGIYKLVPGASAIRTVSRLLIFALVPVTALVFAFLDRARLPAAALGAIVAFLLIEQVQTAPPLAIDVPLQRRMLAAPPPPAGCDAFFVVSARTPADHDAAEAEHPRILVSWGAPPTNAIGLYRHNVDAMLLAAYHDRPTVNGFSTFNPPGWDFAAPDAPDYAARVAAYARRYRMGRLCGLDRRRRPAWFRLDPRPAP